MINEEVCNKSILIVTSPSALSLTTFRSFHHSLTLVALQICPLRSALKTGGMGVIFPRVYTRSGLFSKWRERGGGNWRDEDFSHTCINHEIRAAEGLRPSASEASGK